MKKLFLAFTALLALGLLAACGEAEDTYLTSNPYETVDWNEQTPVLSNLHVHTDESDCASGLPHDVVDFYHEKGYGALAITDHDLVTYPWTFSDLSDDYEDRDPEALDMLDIVGNEFTVTSGDGYHDIVGLFTDYIPDHEETEQETFENVTADEEDALMIFVHPGRYWEIWEDYEPGDRFSVEWYMDFYETYDVDVLPGIEVFNRNNQYQYDVDLWDQLLTESMPERPIWGFANDDFHGESDDRMHRSYIHVMMEDPSSKEEFRERLIEGTFYASNSNPDDTSPLLAGVEVDETERTITLSVDGEYTGIEWYSGYDEETGSGQQVGEGETFEYAAFEGDYVRARIYREAFGRHAETLTQPFGFIEDPDRD